MAPIAERLLASLLEATPAGVVVTDLQNVAVACNREFGDLLGFDSSHVVGADVLGIRAMIRERIPDAAEWALALERVFHDPTYTLNDVFQLRFPEQFVSRHTTPVLGEDGKPIARLWTFRDVTAEVQRNRFAEALAKISAMSDPNPKVVYTEAVELIGSLFGSICSFMTVQGDQLRCEAIGGPADRVRDLQTVPIHCTYCATCLATRAPYVVQDGKASADTRDLLPVQVGLTRYAGVPVFDSAGHAVATLCVMDDRSNEPIHPQLVPFLQAVGFKLGAEWERREAILAADQAIAAQGSNHAQAQRVLAETERLAGARRMAKALAHELGYALEAHLANPAAGLEAFELVADRARSYVRSGVTDYVLLDAGPVAQSVCDRVVRLTGATVKVTVPPKPVYIKADQHQVEYVVLHLLLNAVKAAGPEREINVALTAVDRVVEILVSDSGPGVSDDALERLFEPFSNHGGDGPGLGLFTCRRVAEDHGGSIALVQSTPRGATFALTLPQA